jgi:hypothetical protein
LGRAEALIQKMQKDLLEQLKSCRYWYGHDKSIDKLLKMIEGQEFSHEEIGSVKGSGRDHDQRISFRIKGTEHSFTLASDATYYAIMSFLVNFSPDKLEVGKTEEGREKLVLKGKPIENFYAYGKPLQKKKAS